MCNFPIKLRMPGENVPENASDRDCPGTQSEDAGKTSACEGYLFLFCFSVQIFFSNLFFFNFVDVQINKFVHQAKQKVLLLFLKF